METRYHAAGMSHFIDDFIFVGPHNSNKCVQDLHKFLSLCERVGMPIKEENKTVNPTSVLSVYRIIVDSDKIELRLPYDKIEKKLEQR
jgi:hypothetical protein